MTACYRMHLKLKLTKPECDISMGPVNLEAYLVPLIHNEARVHGPA